MLGEIHAWIALIMPSDVYGRVSQAVAEYQQKHGLPELHGNEIVNPKSKSPWKTIGQQQRLDAFDFVCGLANSSASEVRYVHVSKEQFETIIVESRGAQLKTTKHKSAVKEVFKASLISRLADMGPAIIVFDKYKNNSGPTIESISGADNLIGGGLVRACSGDVPGLQIADIAAYAVGRYLKRRDAIVSKTHNDFDNIAMRFVAQLQGRFASLL